MNSFVMETKSQRQRKTVENSDIQTIHINGFCEILHVL